MPISMTTLTGPIYMPNGITPTNGKVIFELTSWDREENEALFVSGPYITDIDENGEFSIELFTNTSGENNTNYRMFVAHLEDGNEDLTMEYIGFFSLSGFGPYKVSDLDIKSEMISGSFNVLSECAAYALEAKNAKANISNQIINIQDLVNTIEALQTSIGPHGIVVSTEAELQLKLDYDEGMKAEVFGDTVALNGVYAKFGATGTGNWIKISNLSVADLAIRLTSLEDYINSLEFNDFDPNEVYPYSAQMFDKNSPEVVEGHYVSFNNGVVVANSQYSTTPYIPVEETEDYFTTYTHQIAFFDSNKSFIGGIPSTSDRSASTFQTPANAAFVRLTYLAGTNDTFMVNQGTSAVDYVKYGRFLNTDSILDASISGTTLQLGSVPLSALDVSIESYNLFDLNDANVVEDYYIRHDNGQPQASTTYTGSGFIPVTAATEYTRTYSHQAAFYGAAGNYISGIPNPNNPAPSTFIVPEGAVFARFTILKSEVSSFMVYEGTDTKPYAAYGTFIDPARIGATEEDQIKSRFTLNGTPLFTNPSYPDRLRQANLGFSKLAFGEQYVLMIGIFGDSFTEEHRRLTNRMATYLKNKYGEAAGGWCGFTFTTQTGQNLPWTSTNQPAFPQGNPEPDKYPVKFFGNIVCEYRDGGGPGLSSSILSQQGDYITLGIPDTPVHDNVKLMFEGSAGAEVYISWEGETPYAAQLQGNEGEPQLLDIPNVPATASTLKVEWKAGQCVVMGVQLNPDMDTATGVVVTSFGNTGSSITDWSQADSRFDQSMALIPQHVMIYLDGTNSQTLDYTASFWGDEFEVLYNRIAAAHPAVDFLYVSPAENTRNNSVDFAEYDYVARDLQTTLRHTVLSLQNLFGPPNDPSNYAYDGAFPMNVDDGADTDPLNDVHPSLDRGGAGATGGIIKTLTGGL